MLGYDDDKLDGDPDSVNVNGGTLLRSKDGGSVDGTKLAVSVGKSLGTLLRLEEGTIEGIELRKSEGIELGPLDIATLGTKLEATVGLEEGLLDTDGWNEVENGLECREGNTDTLDSELGKYEGDGA